MLFLLNLIQVLHLRKLTLSLPPNLPQLRQYPLLFFHHQIIILHIDKLELVGELTDIVREVVDLGEFILLEIEEFYLGF